MVEAAGGEGGAGMLKRPPAEGLLVFPDLTAVFASFRAERSGGWCGHDAGCVDVGEGFSAVTVWFLSGFSAESQGGLPGVRYSGMS